MQSRKAGSFAVLLPGVNQKWQLLRLQENQTDGSSRSVSDFAATDKALPELTAKVADISRFFLFN